MLFQVNFVHYMAANIISHHPLIKSRTLSISQVASAVAYIQNELLDSNDNNSNQTNKSCNEPKNWPTILRKNVTTTASAFRSNMQRLTNMLLNNINNYIQQTHKHGSKCRTRRNFNPSKPCSEVSLVLKSASMDQLCDQNWPISITFRPMTTLIHRISAGS